MEWGIGHGGGEVMDGVEADNGVGEGVGHGAKPDNAFWEVEVCSGPTVEASAEER
jgi:hypothetical protein